MLVVVGKTALMHIPPPTGMECEAFDFRRGKVSLLYCGKTFDSACMILFGLLLHALFVWVSFGNTEISALCYTVIIYTFGACLHLSSSVHKLFLCIRCEFRLLKVHLVKQCALCP